VSEGSEVIGFLHLSSTSPYYPQEKIAPKFGAIYFSRPSTTPQHRPSRTSPSSTSTQRQNISMHLPNTLSFSVFHPEFIFESGAVDLMQLHKTRTQRHKMCLLFRSSQKSQRR
jgi:hypothetical protein